MFKFDFSNVGNCDTNNHPQNGEKKSDSISGDEILNKLQIRSETSKCTIVNASAQSLMDIQDEVQGANQTFQPKLGFHRQELVDLCSDSVDQIRYVVPQHTLSDNTTDLIPGVYEGKYAHYFNWTKLTMLVWGMKIIL